jgi:site-specific DNA-methyltransferase (adenine-specific)
MQRSVTSLPRQDWETPHWLFEQLDKEFHFTLDGAANAENSKCEWYIDEITDALSVSWKDNVVFLNPPYGRGRMLESWLRKGYEEAQKGATSVWILPASTDTYWWHDYVMTAAEIRFIHGRLHFSGAKKSGWMANVVAIFRPGQDKAFLGPTINARGK